MESRYRTMKRMGLQVVTPSFLKWMTAAAAFVVTALLAMPVHSKLLGIMLVLAAVSVFLGLLLMAWKRLPVRLVVAALPFLALLPFCLPGRPLDHDALQRSYLEGLDNLRGTPYLWGGENGLGIDCSGLPRKALRDSLLSYGLANFNGTAMRTWAEHWWYDAAADALGAGYRAMTVKVPVEGVLRSMPYEKLKPGDLLVVDDGSHVLVYLGQESFIQADPDEGEVTVHRGRGDKSRWFNRKVVARRWSVLVP